MLREIVEEVNLSPILRVKSSKSERIFKPSNNVNYDITILDQHPDLNSGLFKNMNHPPRDKEYMKIEVFNTDEKKALKTLKSEIKKLEKKGYEIVFSERIGTKGQNWTGLIYKYGTMFTAFLMK